MRRLLRQSERFLGTIAWFFARTVRQQPARFVAFVAASGSGLVALSLGFGVVFAVLSALERGEPLAFRGVTLDPSDRLVLSLVAAGAGLVVMLGAVLVYVARQLVILASSALQRKMASEVLDARAPILDDPRAYASQRRLRATLLRLASGNARRCALALRRGLDVPVPLTVALASLVVLFVLEPLAAGVSVVLGLSVVPAMYRVNLRGVRASKRYETLVAPARKELMTLVERRAQGEAVARELAAGAPSLAALVAAFQVRVGAALRADLASQLLAAATTFGLLVYLGIAVLDGRIGLVGAGAFMVALRLVMGGARAVFVGVATMSRYYPFLYQHRRFLRGLRPPAADGRSVATAGRLRAAPGALREPGVALPATGMPAGGVWSLTPPLPLDALGEGYAAVLLGGGDTDTARLVRLRILAATSHAQSDAPIAVRAIDDLDEAARQRPDPGSGALLLWCLAEPPEGLGSPLHVVGGPDGRVLSWGSVSWMRSNWDAVAEVARAARAAAEGASLHGDLDEEEDA